MKKIVAAVALATVLASPAFARTVHHPAAHAANSQNAVMQDRDTVTFGGQYLGRDPDPQVRMELYRDNNRDAG